jgi:hypothetical protein
MAQQDVSHINDFSIAPAQTETSPLQAQMADAMMHEYRGVGVNATKPSASVDMHEYRSIDMQTGAAIQMHEYRSPDQTAAVQMHEYRSPDQTAAVQMHEYRSPEQTA